MCCQKLVIAQKYSVLVRPRRSKLRPHKGMFGAPPTFTDATCKSFHNHKCHRRKFLTGQKTYWIPVDVAYKFHGGGKFFTGRKYTGHQCWHCTVAVSAHINFTVEGEE